MEKQYRILILIAQKQIQALSVDDKGRTEPISINGNVRMSYNSSDDLDELITSIKDTYNIDSFSDLVFSVFVINFDADTKILKKLCAMLDGAKDLNVVNAAFILPFASGKKEKFKKDENRFVQILESNYRICLNEDFSSVCEKADNGADENTQILVAEDFAFIFNLNAKDFGLLEEEIKAETTEETLQEQPSNIPEEKTEQIPEKESLPMVVESQPPAVTENKISKMIFVEGGIIGEQQVRTIGGTIKKQPESISSFVMGATPVTLQEWYDVMGYVTDAIMGMELIRKKIFKLERGKSFEGVNHYEYIKALSEIKTFQYLSTPFVDEKHEEILKKGGTLILPKSVLENVDGDMRKNYKFMAYEDLVQDAIAHYGKNVPVTYIDYFDAIAFCSMKSKKEGLEEVYSYDGEVLSDLIKEDWWREPRYYRKIVLNTAANGWRLPKFSEWLYAAKGGKNQQKCQYAGSNTLGDVAWYKENSDGRLHEVAQKKPNVLGLFDMCGNVWEMTTPAYTDLDSGVKSWNLILLGGSVFSGKNECSLYNDKYDIQDSYIDNQESQQHQFFTQTGFRICRTAESAVDETGFFSNDVY